MEQAIKKAIEGGWRCPIHDGWELNGTKEWIESIGEGDWPVAEFFLDPKFWQALGKSLGWKEVAYVEGKGNVNVREWKEQWHSFIDHLISGKDAESFFTSLLTQKE